MQSSHTGYSRDHTARLTISAGERLSRPYLSSVDMLPVIRVVGGEVAAVVISCVSVEADPMRGTAVARDIVDEANASAACRH